MDPTLSTVKVFLMVFYNHRKEFLAIDCRPRSRFMQLQLQIPYGVIIFFQKNIHGGNREAFFHT